MPITEEQYNSVQEYLAGRMPESQKQQFLAELDSDETLREYLDFEIQLKDDLQRLTDKKEIYSLYNQLEDGAVDADDNPVIKKMIDQAAQQWMHLDSATKVIVTPAPPEKRIENSRLAIMRPWVMIAAACFVMAVIGLFYLFNFSKTNGDDELKNQLAGLYDSYFQKDTVPHAALPLLARAFSDYEKDNYATMENYDLENLPTLKGVQDNQKQLALEYGYYYKGISYLQTKDFRKADSCFKWVIEEAEKKDLQGKAKWYLALSLIKTGNTKKAIEWLEKLSSDSGTGEYNTKALELLENLKKTIAAQKQP